MQRGSVIPSPAGQLSDLIGDIYEAIARPETWPTVLDAVCHYVGGISANLFSDDEGVGGVRLFHSVGEDPEFTRSYVEIYRHLNPYFPAFLLSPEGEVMVGADFMPHTQFRRTRFYQEWVRPQGYIDIVGVSLVRHEGGSVFMAIRRGEKQGLADARAVRRMRLLTPHIRRAVLIGQVLEACRRDASSLEQMMSTMASAIFLVDADTMLVRANREGARLLDEGSVVFRSTGRLRAVQPRMQDGLADAIARSAASAARHEGHVVPLDRRDQYDQSRWYAHVMPLRDPNQPPLRAQAVVFVRNAALGMEAPIGVLRQLYHLTDAQTRVLGAVVNIGGSVEQVADTLGLSVNTVRAHLRELFVKTGATRQAELVRLVAAHMPSIAIAAPKRVGEPGPASSSGERA